MSNVEAETINKETVKEEKKVISYKDNAFDLLKIMAAVIVLLSHSFRHFEVDKPIWSLFFTDGSVGVMMFFAISGFTIMPSWGKMSGKGWRGYFKFLFNRFIRIIPPIVFSFIIITIANASLKGINPFSWDYLWYAFKYCFLFLDHSYKGIGISNGVLWTMYPTVLFYIIAPLVFMIMKNQKTYVWIIVILAFWQFNLWDVQFLDLLDKIPVVNVVYRFFGIAFPLCFIYEFLIGSFLYFKRRPIIEFFMERKWLIYVILVVFTGLFVFYRYFDYIPKNYLMHSPYLGLIVPFITIVLGFVMGKIRIKYELSYGLLLFHMICVGILLSLGVTGWLGILLTICTAPILAFASRILVEQPLLKLKISK